MRFPHYALLGHPVQHSFSPRIHAAFGLQTQLPIIYLALDTRHEGFAATLRRFEAAGGVGANVTVPDKFDASAACHVLSERARRAGAVNTLILRDGYWEGDNTDGSGLVTDLTQRRGIALAGRRVLLLGAGGAASGIAPALLDAGIGQLVVANRGFTRAMQLVRRLDAGDRTHACTLEALDELGSFDLIIQATSAAQSGSLPPLPASLLDPETVCVDLNYGHAALEFMAWARQKHCQHVYDGLGMLVEQAADAFLHWHGIRPDTDAVYTRLRLMSRSR